MHCVVLPHLELKPNCGSDRAWVWSTPADFADEEPKPELLAIRFANAESKQQCFRLLMLLSLGKLPGATSMSIEAAILYIVVHHGLIFKILS